MISKITSKFQITIPKEIRRRLRLSMGDSIEWIAESGKILVRPAGVRVMELKGSIKVGKGAIKDDIVTSRAMRARKVHG